MTVRLRTLSDSLGHRATLGRDETQPVDSIVHRSPTAPRHRLSFSVYSIPGRRFPHFRRQWARWSRRGALFPLVGNEHAYDSALYPRNSSGVVENVGVSFLALSPASRTLVAGRIGSVRQDSVAAVWPLEEVPRVTTEG